MPSWRYLMKDVTRGLNSAPWNIKNPNPASYMHIHEQHSVCICIMTRWTKIIGIPNCHSNRKSFWFKFPIQPPFWSISMPHTLTNSSYQLNTTHFQFTQYHPKTFKMKSYQNLLPTSNMVGVMVCSIFMLRHKASSPYNFNIQFPHVYQIHHTCIQCRPEYLHALILCHIHSATYWTQVFWQISYFHDIYSFFPLHIIHNKMTCD